MTTSTTAPKLPIEIIDGRIASYSDSEIESLIKQNVKMVLLTFPGERIMWPSFGVGIQKYLFEFQSGGVTDNIMATINRQMRMWIPSITVTKIVADADVRNPENLYLTITYDIDFLNAKGELQLLLEY